MNRLIAIENLKMRRSELSNEKNVLLNTDSRMVYRTKCMLEGFGPSARMPPGLTNVQMTLFSFVNTRHIVNPIMFRGF